MADSLHLVKVPLRADKLIAIARGRGLPLRDLDDGYLCHCIMRELWQSLAPAPFVLRGRGRTLDAWGYSSVEAAALVDHARAFGDPSVLAAITAVDGVVSKLMPQFARGRRVGFLLRACPVVRLTQASHGHREGAEVDAFLARAFAAGKEAVVSREAVYRDWLATKVNREATTGVTLESVGIAGIARERLVRRTQGHERKASRLERPDVRFEGTLVVTDGERFNAWLRHGVGRHRAFGFGALILAPPGTTHTV
ncbi:MAG: type I-E CRISPR-associated protein Cas6/Cse3/CasE [Acidobacteriota bacterium]